MVNKVNITQGIDQRIQEVLPALECRRMEQIEDREAALKLRYEGYSQSFPVPENWTGFTDKFDDCFNSTTFGIYLGDRLASTIRLTVVTKDVREAQAVSMYGDVLNPMLDDGAVFVDATRLSVDKDCAELIPELPYISLRLITVAGCHYNADAYLSALRTRHIPFYKRIFGGRPISEAVYYPPLQSDFTLMYFPLDEIGETLFRKFPSFESTYLERRQLFGRAEDIFGVKSGSVAA